MKFRKENGRTYSAEVFGYDNVGERGSNGKIIDGKLIPNEGEQFVIKQILRWHNGGLSLNGIARHLNDTNIPSKKGGRWSAKTVRDIIKNTLNVETI
jgi:hypothetical protein